MRVGNALYAEVALGGKLLESSVQGFMEQQWNNWPLSAKYAPPFVTVAKYCSDILSEHNKSKFICV